MDIRTVILDENGRITELFTDKQVMQFSHNQVFIGVLIPKIDFDGVFLSYKNEYHDIVEEIALTVNAEYISNDYYQVIIPLIQSITKDYGSIDLYLEFRKGNYIVIKSEAVKMLVTKSALYNENIIEYDIATQLANSYSSLSAEMADLKSQIALNGVGSPVIIKYYGEETSGKIKVGTPTEILSWIADGTIQDEDVYFEKET